MRNSLVLATTISALVALAAPAHGQGVFGTGSAATPPAITVTPYAGYMMYGDLVKGPVGTRLTNANSAVYGAQLGISLTPNLAVFGNVAHANADLQVGAPLLGGLSVGKTGIWMYDGGLELHLTQLGTTGAITPFVQLGAGQMRYDFESGPLNTRTTNVAFNGGLGLDVRLARGVALRAMAKDYVGKFDAKAVEELGLHGQTTNNWALSAGLSLGF
jgi:hypothetical protein